jgi:hypothetical protein
LISQHGPKNLNPLSEVPRELIKLETFINQQVPAPKVEFYSESVVLPPYELYK